jgi:hypothetical protein
MSQIEFFRVEAASVAGYYNALTKIFAGIEADAGPDFDREWHCTLLASAMAHLYYQRAGEHFSCLEGNRLRQSLHDIADSVFQVMGYEGYARPAQRRKHEGDPGA